jgi:site-specific DNA-methyltransferase (cytosine-N4-specific)
MPESVKDRLSNRHENIFMFTKSQRYHFDLDAIREPHAEVSLARAGRRRLTPDRSQEGVGSPHTLDPASYANSIGKNPGDVWSIGTQPFSGAHFAVFPPEIPRRCIVAGCKPGGTVLDPFSGSGTTGLVAQENGRRYVGIDLSPDYLKLSLETRLQNATLDFGAA